MCILLLLIYLNVPCYNINNCTFLHSNNNLTVLLSIMYIVIKSNKHVIICSIYIPYYVVGWTEFVCHFVVFEPVGNT